MTAIVLRSIAVRKFWLQGTDFLEGLLTFEGMELVVVPKKKRYSGLNLMLGTSVLMKGIFKSKRNMRGEMP